MVEERRDVLLNPGKKGHIAGEGYIEFLALDRHEREAQQVSAESVELGVEEIAHAPA
jgi:hypothetical protein